MIEVRRVEEEDWPTLRSVRLAVLRDAPHAFASTFAEEAPLAADEWRRRIRSAAWFLAWDGSEPVGISAVFAEAGAPVTDRHLIAMWVAPHRRRQGVDGALCDAVAGWALSDGAGSLSLWVADGNDRARRAYERYGFVTTGRTQPLPSDPGRSEERMRLDLRAGPPHP